MITGDIAGRLRAGGSTSPVLVVIAGPNGAGQSTFYDVFLRDLRLPFVNADLIADATADSGAPEARARRSARRADSERADLVTRRESFCTETVFSDPVGARLTFLKDAQRAGFSILLVFIGLADPSLAAARVAQRVAAGGHPVPEERLRARFPRTLGNARRALAFVEEAWIFDNSSLTAPYRLIARWARGRRTWKAARQPEWAATLAPSKK